MLSTISLDFPHGPRTHGRSRVLFRLRHAGRALVRAVPAVCLLHVELGGLVRRVRRPDPDHGGASQRLSRPGRWRACPLQPPPLQQQQRAQSLLHCTACNTCWQHALQGATEVLLRSNPAAMALVRHCLCLVCPTVSLAETVPFLAALQVNGGTNGVEATIEVATDDGTGGAVWQEVWSSGLQVNRQQHPKERQAFLALNQRRSSADRRDQPGRAAHRVGQPDRRRRCQADLLRRKVPDLRRLEGAPPGTPTQHTTLVDLYELVS